MSKSGLVNHLGQPWRRDGYQVVEISAELRASKEFGSRGWRTIQLGARADVAPGADVTFAHNALYEELRERISLLLGEEARVSTRIGNQLHQSQLGAR